MKTKFKSKLLGVLLVLVMVLALVPVSALTAFAAEQNEVVTHDIDQIRELLRQDGDVKIKLDADAEKKLTSYSDFENTKWDSQYVWTKLGSGNKTIDLNGHRLYVYDQSARSLGSLDWMAFRYIQGALLMEIPNGASLTVNDSNGGGKIWMDAEMPDKSEMEGSGLLMERNIFAVTGGNLTINGGEIHAGRSKEIYAQNAPKYDKNYEPIIDYTIGDFDFYEHLYGYATWFLSGTAITAESGNVTINGGNIWGRGWDNWSMITRVPGAPNGADDYRTRCAALRVLGTATAHITSGSFYGRSDADAVQVSNPNNLTVDAGSFDVGTNSLLVVPGVEWDGTADNINDIFFHDSVFEVHEGYVGSFGIPAESLDDGSDAFISADGKTMTIAPIGSQTFPYKTIGDIGLYMNSPLAYKSPVDNANDIYGVPSDCEVESITWYENGHILENASSTYFKEGDSYYAKIALAANEYAKFNYNLTDATINGKTAEIYRKDDRHIVLTVHFGDCVAAIEDVAFYAEEPLAGNYPSKWIDSNENNPYYAVGGYSNYGEYRTWYVSDDGVSGWTEMNGETPFEAGKYYRLTFEIHTSEGQEFAVDASGVSVMPDVTATVNGMPATVQKVYEQDPTQHIAVEIDFGKCPAAVQFVDLSVTAPKEGETISYTVGSAQDAYYAIGDNSNYTDYRAWYESDTGYDNWRLMSPGETFKAGKYYKFITDIHTKNGYVFSTYDDGISIQPNVGAYVNDNGAKVTKGYEQDPSNYITVEYFFGICFDTVVEKIDVENVVSPVAGKTPTYTVSIRGNGYLLEGKTSGNWKVNGIVWIDGDPMTGSTMDKTDTFLPGHTYTVMINFVPAMGYSFLFDHNNSRYATVTVNGETANFNIDNTSANKYQVYYTFTCGQKQVDTITITDLDTPVGGNTPDTTVTSGEPDFYTVESVTWFDIEDGSVGATFEAGVPYYAKVVIASVKSSGTDIAKFVDAENLKISINGDPAVIMEDSIAVENNKVTICVRFRKPASAPIVVPYMFTTQPAGNTVKVDENVNVNWQITFNATKTEIQQWNGSAWVVFNDTVQTQNGAGQYQFTSNTAKAMRLRIVAYIGEDAVATSSEFTVVWEEDVQEFMYSYFPGEGSGTGDSDIVASGTQITLASGTMFEAPDGYRFKAWAIGSLNGEQKQPGDKITITAETYIYAVWEELPSFMVSYNSNGGSGTMVGDMITENGTFTLENCTFEAPDGYRFKAWAIGSVNGEQKQPSEKITITAETYIYAIWEVIPHECSGVLESGQGATCTVNGWNDYYKCSCGKLYTDAACTNEITDLNAWKVGAGMIEAKHNYGELVSTVTEKHTQTELVASVAAHYHCSACGKYFTEGKAETTLEALTGTVPTHSFGAWQTDNDKHWRECSCGLTSEEASHAYGSDTVCDTCEYDNTVPHVHGNGVKKIGQGATCTADGWSDYYKCSCGKFFTDSACTDEITDLSAWKIGAGKIAGGHSYGDLIGAAAEKHTQTELAASVAAHYRCSVCGKYFTEDKVETTLEALTGEAPAHVFGAWQNDSDTHWKECACGKKSDEGAHIDGDGNSECDTCQKTLSGVTPPPHTHDYGTTWKSDGTNHWKECACGEKSEMNAHGGGTSTCTAKAKCSVCGTEYGELAEHQYSEATCTKKAICSVCGDEKGELAAHTYVDGKCTCGATDPNYVPPHEHKFVEGKCECGETDPNYVAPHEHNFVEGKCECGETDPDYQPPEEPKDGLGAGAIAGIAVGSVAVLGGGGFALWWFVFRKKKMI